ncbi:MAG: hypothetical protein VXY92_14605 [Planctomycetota bacterium]|nr:hypothetical protein [Planctomycetota bacterium]
MNATTSTVEPRLLFAALLLAVAGCSGGGGGGLPDTQATPVIIAAAFNGAGPAPAAGDTLLLGFSMPVTLRTGKLLTDEDLTLTSGDSLGLVDTAPSLLSANTVTIRLGEGVVFTPGVSTIQLSAGNDVVSGLASEPQGGGDAVVIGSSDGVAPILSDVTIAGIDGEMNGTGAAGGVLQTPSNGWEIDLAYNDNTAIDTAQTVISADGAVTASGGALLPGANLTSLLVEASATNTSATYRVPASVEFPQSAVTLTVIVADASGLTSAPTTFSFTVRPFTDALQPFETGANASQVWFLDFARDLESYTTSPFTGGPAGASRVDVTAGSNGVSDFEDLLRVLGVTSASPISNVQSGMDSNEVATARLKDLVVADLEDFYRGANITFTLSQPAGSFGGNTSVAYSSLGYSAISIAGQPSTPGVLGLAIFDPSNTTQNDNTVVDFGSSQERLGVFLHTIVDAGLSSLASSSFRTTFDTFAPSQGGTPIGDDGLDGDRLLGLVGDARQDDIDAALAEFARFIASVTAHECGHSVGLVANGPMPTGLYGNDSVNFPGSANGHIRNLSLFPGGATNLMSPALSYTNATSPATSFNTLNMAYLREQIFYGN